MADQRHRINARKAAMSRLTGKCDARVFMALDDLVGADNCAWPSLATLCEMTGLGRRSVQKGIVELSRAGIVIVEHVSGRGNRYRLAMQNPHTVGRGSDEAEGETRTLTGAPPAHCGAPHPRTHGRPNDESIDESNDGFQPHAAPRAGCGAATAAETPAPDNLEAGARGGDGATGAPAAETPAPDNLEAGARGGDGATGAPADPAAVIWREGLAILRAQQPDAGERTLRGLLGRAVKHLGEDGAVAAIQVARAECVVDLRGWLAAAIERARQRRAPAASGHGALAQAYAMHGGRAPAASGRGRRGSPLRSYARTAGEMHEGEDGGALNDEAMVVPSSAGSSDLDRLRFRNLSWMADRELEQFMDREKIGRFRAEERALEAAQ